MTRKRRFCGLQRGDPKKINVGDITGTTNRQAGQAGDAEKQQI